MPDFRTRSRLSERMDDPSIAHEELRDALAALRQANRLLGGHRVTRSAVASVSDSSDGPLEILDVGAGLGDHAVELVRWGARRRAPVRVTLVDVNPATVELARRHCAARLPDALRDHVRFACADALDLPYDDGAFDLTLATLFLHHFDDPSAVGLLTEMARVSRRAVVVNDLHRHPLAWLGFHAVARVTRAPSIFREDGSVSILRGFTRDELFDLAGRAGLSDVRIRWAWAFRWSMVGRPAAR